MTLELSAELEPPPEPKSKAKRGRRPDGGRGGKAKNKRGPARPHRRLAEELLTTRIKKLNDRLERARKQVLPPARFIPQEWHALTWDPEEGWQHEDTRRLLTKYLHESTYRLRETLASQQQQPPLDCIPALPEDGEPAAPAAVATSQ